VKQSGAVKTLQEIEVPTGGNGRGEPLAGTRHERNVDRAWLLWESRRLLYRFALRGLILATIVAFLLPKQYISIARLMPPEKETGSSLSMMASMMSGGSGGGGGGGGSLGDVANDLLGTKSQGALYTDVLRGRTVADGLIARFDLRKVYGVHYWADARDRLAAHTEIAEDRKSGIIVIKVREHDPRRAADLAQGYVEELNTLIAAVSTSAARRERIFIEQRLKTVKQDLNTAAQRFSEYSSKNTAIDIPEQGKAMVDAAAMLKGQLIATQSELEGLSQIYTDSNVRVRSLRARVTELQRQLVKMGGDNASLAGGSSASGTNLGSGDLNSDDMYPSIRKLPLLGVRWADLYRESKIQETVYELLTEQYEIAKIQEAKETPSVEVYDVANVPEKASGPPRLLIMVIGTVLSFALGAAYILVRAKWHEADPDSPYKQFAGQVGRDIWVSAFQPARRVRERFAQSRLAKWFHGSAAEGVQKSE
jgi:uncharacterized protein involved in exopolysaccharide biosynthesis